MAYLPQTTGVLQTPQTYSTSPTSYDSAYGGIPTLPKYTTDTSTSAGTDVNSQMIANLPNYQAMLGQATGNIGANLAGQVAPDVSNNLAQQAAERGVGMGSALSPNATTGFLARYGLTSNALQTQGQQQLLSQMQATPIQQTQTGQTQQDQAAAQAVYSSAPVPAAAAKAAQSAAQAGMSAGRGAVSAPSVGGTYGSPTSNMGYGNLFSGASGGGMTPGQTEMDDLLKQFGLGSDAGSSQTGSTWGFQPTSKGSMYIGSQEGYQPSIDPWNDWVMGGQNMGSGAATSQSPTYDFTDGMQPIGQLGGMNVMQSVGGDAANVYQQNYGQSVPEGMQFNAGMDTLEPQDPYADVWGMGGY